LRCNITLKKGPFAVKLSIKIKINRYTPYYVNQSGGGGEVGPINRTSFRVQRVTA